MFPRDRILPEEESPSGLIQSSHVISREEDHVSAGTGSATAAGREVRALLCSTLTGLGSGAGGAGESSVMTVRAFSSILPEAEAFAFLVTSNSRTPEVSAQAFHSTAM